VKLKKLLIITYYWPPTGGVGVQRWLKFSKQLVDLGYSVSVLTPSSDYIANLDSSLQSQLSKEIVEYKVRVKDSFSLLKYFVKSKSSSQHNSIVEKRDKNIIEKLILWARANIIIPDPRINWVKPAFSKLDTILREQTIDLVITTGPPHSTHLIGLKLKKKYPYIKWLVDFRDPWTDWDIYKQMPMSRWAYNKHLKLEKEVIEKCDKTITIGKSLAEAFNLKTSKKVDFVMNGLGFQTIPQKNSCKSDSFLVSYFGILNNQRNPSTLWKALNQCCEEDKAFYDKLELVLGGIISESVINEIKSYSHLKEKLKLVGYLSHNEVLTYCHNSSLNLLLLNNTDNSKWIIPMKLFDYLTCEKPILMVGLLKSDAGEIISDMKAGEIVGFEDFKGMKKAFIEAFDMKNKQKKFNHAIDLEKFSIEKNTEKLSRIIQSIP